MNATSAPSRPLLGYGTNGLADHPLDDALDLLQSNGYRAVALTLGHPHFDVFGDGWLDRASDPATWAPVDAIPDEELWAARNEARSQLVAYVRAKSIQDRLLRGEAPEVVKSVAETFSEDTLTLGFARRIATYKRLFLLTYDPERVRRIFADGPPVQMVVAGKAHPLDDNAKQMLVDVFGLSQAVGITSRVAFLENYDLSVAAPIVGGADVVIVAKRLSGIEAVLEHAGRERTVIDLVGLPLPLAIRPWSAAAAPVSQFTLPGR